MHSIFDERRYLIPFRAALLPQIFTDVLVIGAGVAGLRAGLAAADRTNVIVAFKGDLKQSNTYWAQGGIASVFGAGDSFDTHVADTLAAGAQLCDEPVVRKVVESGPAHMSELAGWGMGFDLQDGTDRFALGREGGHSAARILHAGGDATGRALSNVLERRARAHERIRMFDDCFVLDLLTLDGAAPRCLGAITHHPRYGLQVIWAGAVILAAGGTGQVYRESTNPPSATCDGLAIAYRAGACVADMSFVQFHPTTLYVAGASRSLISEAVRGEGAILVDRNGHRFMADYDGKAELAPRDIVSRAILEQMARTGFTHVFLDARRLGQERFARRFPEIHALLTQFGLDPGKDLIPVHPSAHYMVGGVRTDEYGRTSLRGLYAAGEVACTGLHGANRLASNSLLEGLVFGKAVGEVCGESLEGYTDRSVRLISDIRPSERSELDLADVRSSLRSVMWRHVGIQRDGAHLSEVAEMFDFWARYTLDKIFDEREGWEIQNMLLAGALITRAAVWREESRGTHSRIDYPRAADGFRLHDLWQRGCARPRTAPVRAADFGNGAPRSSTADELR